MEVELFEGKNIAIGVLGIISLLLLGFGGSELLEPEQFENAYVCDLTGKLGVFLGGVSGTLYTGYPHAEDRTDPARCKLEFDGIIQKGQWIKLEDYASDRGVDPLSLFVQEPIVGPSGEDGVDGKDGEDGAVIVERVLIPSGNSGNYCCSPGGCVVGAC